MHATQNQMRPGEVALPPLSPKACIVPSIISGRDTLARVYEMFSFSSTSPVKLTKAVDYNNGLSGLRA